MATWLVRRLIQAIFVVMAMTVIVFIGVNVIGDPIEILISPEADAAERARAIAALGLDKPLWQQYLVFLSGLLRGDLGRSFVFNEPAIKVILQRLPATMELAVAAVLISIIIGIPAGLYAGLKPNGWIARTLMAGSILGFSLPSFWVGLMFIMVFAVQLGWLPSTGRGTTVAVFGIQWSFLTRKTAWPTWSCPPSTSPSSTSASSCASPAPASARPCPPTTSASPAPKASAPCASSASTS